VPLAPTAPFRVVVVGAGFAGTTTSVQLLRAWRGGPLRLTLLESGGDPGPGVAFSTPDARHLLNVVAGSMSALPDEPDHFLDWLRERAPDATAGTFAPRLAYGAYLRGLLDEAIAEAPAAAEVTRLRDEAVAVDEGGSELPGGRSHAVATVRTAGGRRLEADAVVLAVGVNRPRTPSGVVPELLDHPGWVGDPWDHARLEALAAAERVAIVGSGLTMIDVAITLAGAGRAGAAGGGRIDGGAAGADAGRRVDDGAAGAAGRGPRLLALSRRGALPRAHRSAPPPRLTTFRPPLGPLTADRLAAHVESAALAEVAAGGDWRSAVDGVRPYTQRLWQALPLGEQARFLARHARRWEIHRHRMAPAVAARVAALRESGRLELRAGSLQRVAPLTGGDGAAPIELVYRGREGVTRVTVDAVVNCTGPDPAPTADPLLSGLIAAGRARAGALGLGLDTALDGELRDCDGEPSPGLYTLGALRRGQLWESTAVPEIRCQAQELGALLAARGAALCAARATAA